MYCSHLISHDRNLPVQFDKLAAIAGMRAIQDIRPWAEEKLATQQGSAAQRSCFSGDHFVSDRTKQAITTQKLIGNKAI